MADINIAGTLRSGAADKKLAVSEEIYDEKTGCTQSELNGEFRAQTSMIGSLSERVTRLEIEKWKKVAWGADSNLNDFTTEGVYLIEGHRVSSEDNMPIMNLNADASIVARLFVQVSPDGETVTRKIIGQTLILSNAEGHETKIYTRSANCVIPTGEAEYTTTWGEWQVLQGMREVGVHPKGDFDNFTENGIYSGAVSGEELPGRIMWYVLVVIAPASNAGGNGQVSQLRYGISGDGTVVVETRRRYNNSWSSWLSVGGGIIYAGEVSNLDDLTDDGIYRGTNGGETFVMIVVNDAASSKVMQYKFAVSSSITYDGVVTITRQRENGTWTPWSVPNYTQLNTLAKAAAESKFNNMAEASPEVLETIKNIGEWIETDTTGSAQLIEDVKNLKESRAYKDVTLVEGMMNSLVTEGLYRILGTTTEGIDYNLPEGITGTINALIEVLDASSSAASITQKLTLSNNGNGEVYIRTATGSMASLVWEAWRTLGTGNGSSSSAIEADIKSNFVSSAHSIANSPNIPFILGSYISYNDGKEMTSAMSGATPYISTFNIKSIFTTAVIASSGAKIAFYDENKNYLKDLSINGTSSEQIYEFSSELKETAKYFRVSFYGTNQSHVNARNTIKITFEKDNNPIYDYINTLESDVYLNTLNTQGVTFTDSFDLSTSNLSNYNLHNLPIPAGTPITFKFVKVPKKLSLIISYKGGPTNQAVAVNITTGDIFEFTPDKDIDYFGYYMFKAEGNTNAEIVTQVLTQQAFESQTLADKKVLNLLIFGDSITQSYANLTYKSVDEPYTTILGSITGTNWSRQIVESKINNINFSLGEVRNYAKSGASFRNRHLEDRQYLGFQVDEAFADLNAPEDGYYYGKEFTPDVIIVSIGTNDGPPASNDTYEHAMSKTVMKTVSGTDSQVIDIEATLNNLDVENFIGDSIRHSFMRLRQRFPDALFIYATPIQRSAYETPENQIELFTTLARRYNFIIADCNSESGIVRDFQTWDGSTGDLKDGLHPTEEGSKKIAKCIMHKMLTNILYSI